MGGGTRDILGFRGSTFQAKVWRSYFFRWKKPGLNRPPLRTVNPHLDSDWNRMRSPTVEDCPGVPLRGQGIFAHSGRDVLTFANDDAIWIRLCAEKKQISDDI